jgi:hypothetical protein
MTKLAFSYDNAMGRLAIYGLSNSQARAALASCPIAGHFDNRPYYYPADIDHAADCYIDGLSIDNCAGE